MSALKNNILKLYMFKLFSQMHFIGAVIVPFFMDWGGISFLQVMILQTFFVFAVFALEVPTGAVADHFGRRISVLLGIVSTVFAVLLYQITPSYALFFAAEAFWALGFALISGADEALVYDTLKRLDKDKESKKVLGRYNSFGIIGFMIGAPAGSIIAQLCGLRFTMLLMVVPLLISAAIILSVAEPKTQTRKESSRYIEGLKDALRYLKGHRVLRILAFDAVSVLSLTFFAFWLYQPMLSSLGITIIFFGFLGAAMDGFQIAVMNMFPWLERVFRGRKNYIFASAIIPGVAFVMLGIFPSAILAFILFPIIAGIGVSRWTLLSNYMNKYIESKNRATVLSAVSMMEKLARGILYLVVGIIAQVSLSASFIFIGVLIVVASVLSRVEEAHLID